MFDNMECITRPCGYRYYDGSHGVVDPGSPRYDRKQYVWEDGAIWIGWDAGREPKLRIDQNGYFTIRPRPI